MAGDCSNAPEQRREETSGLSLEGVSMALFGWSAHYAFIALADILPGSLGGRGRVSGE